MENKPDWDRDIVSDISIEGPMVTMQADIENLKAQGINLAGRKAHLEQILRDNPTRPSDDRSKMEAHVAALTEYLKNHPE